MKNSKRRKWDSKLQMTFIYFYFFFGCVAHMRINDNFYPGFEKRRFLLHNLTGDGREEKWVSKQGFVLFTHIFTVIWCITANILWGNNPNWTSETRISAAWWLFYTVHVLIFFFFTFPNKVWRTVRRKNKKNNINKKSF